MILLRAHTVIGSDLSHRVSALAIEGALIVACGEFDTLRRRYRQAEIVDVSDCVALPGLVNAHSHLELSDLQGRAPFEGDFVKWLGGVTQGRRELKGELSDTIADACKMSLTGGVTSVGDVCFRHRAWRHLARQPIRKTCYAEVFGMTSDLESPRAYLERCIEETQEDELLRLGLSPHAPYSAGPGVYEFTGRLAKEHQLPLVTHMAETEAEVEFLTKGSGGWMDYLQRIHMWDGSFAFPGKRPVEYFLSLPISDQSFLLAHVNYINDEELEALAKTQHSVAYCPRSHGFFGHRPHRFREMSAAGINVCLGTDSLASNSSLSILDEMRYLHREFGDPAPEAILAMATVNGAKAIGWSDKIGVIEEGKEADLAVIPLQNFKRDPLVDVLESEEQVKLTMVRGRCFFP
jgi:cytosine/adenosine deaminase-related metal-dependent hydrolase